MSRRGQHSEPGYEPLAGEVRTGRLVPEPWSRQPGFQEHVDGATSRAFVCRAREWEGERQGARATGGPR